MTLSKYPSWKQNNPVDQLIVITMSMEGHTDNWNGDVITLGQYLDQVAAHLKQIQELIPFLKDPTKW